jgi:septal ring factor EnvC (AmiA/AmiB activator)
MWNLPMPNPLRVAAVFLVMALWPVITSAQQRKEVESDLADTMEALHSASKEQKTLQARNAKLRKELGSLQEELVSITGKMQRQEQLLSELEENLQNLQTEERAKADKLLRRRHELASMVQTMLKLSRVPPEMVVAMPGDFENTMRTAKVLGLTTNTLSQQAEQISDELAEIQALQGQIKRSYRQIAAQKANLQKNESLLTAKLDEREKIQGKLLSRYEEKEKQIRNLSETSNTLKELMSQLESQHKAKKSQLALVPSVKPRTMPLRDSPPEQGKSPRTEKSSPSQGKISLPAQGKIFIFYGDKTNTNDVSRGISIRTRKNAKVTAPYDGEIVYTGTFLEYGNMVIVRHAGGYHSLLAGMETIRAKLGQNVIKDEPIGEMGRNDEQTALYMEIRKNNRPIDPMLWLENQHHATKQ